MGARCPLVNSAGGGVLQVANRLLGSGARDRGTDALDLEQTDQALPQRIIVGIAINGTMPCGIKCAVNPHRVYRLPVPL